MTLIKKIQLAAEKNGFNVYVSGNKRDYKIWKVATHSKMMGLPYKAIIGDDKNFDALCGHLMRQRKGTQGYRYISYIAGVSSRCEFIDGDFTYVVSTYGRGYMILVYKN